MSDKNHRSKKGFSKHQGSDKRGDGRAQNERGNQKKEADKKIVGFIVSGEGQLRLRSCDKKKGKDLHDLDTGGISARPGDVVVAELMQSAAGRPRYKIKQVLGRENTPGIFSLISIHEKGLSDTFNQAALKEAEGMTVPDLQGREDLRGIPLVTIDGADARDFDDAVFAEATPDGGFHIIVAIADVSWYVRPGTELDKEALLRGNSTYFPDRVVPMLPEALSNGLCSLKPHEDRAVMAFHLWIDKEGNLTRHKVARGLMNSAARLTYGQVQAAKDGAPDKVTAPLMDKAIKPLYAAYALLRDAREKRGALDLEQAEYKVAVDTSGKMVALNESTRPDSCRVIEEFMILANVAAATALESKGAACVYRVHGDLTGENAAENFCAYLKTAYGISVTPEEVKNAAGLKSVLDKAAGEHDRQEVISGFLRTLAKAVYKTDNTGHFGLALERYAHFTSPIRRYADLLVHRSLADAFNLGAGGLAGAQKAELQSMADHISATERASIGAERSADERMAAAYLSSRVGDTFTGRVVSVTDFGLFVRVKGVEGLIPLRNLNDDYYMFDAKERTLTGRDHGRVYRRGDSIAVKVKDASGLTGRVTLAAVNDNAPGGGVSPQKKQGPRV